MQAVCNCLAIISLSHGISARQTHGHIGTEHILISAVEGIGILPARARIGGCDLDRLDISTEWCQAEVRVSTSPGDSGRVGGGISRIPET